MCCIMGYTGHDLPAAAFRDYLLRTVSRGPDDQRVIEGPFGLMGFGRLAIMGLTPDGMQPFTRGADCVSALKKPSSSGRATSSARAATARSCCPSTTSTGWICSGIWTPSSP